MAFPFFQQFDISDCGPTCLRMVAKYHGVSIQLQSLRDRCNITRQGVSILAISQAAESIGLHSLAVCIDYEQLLKEATLPAIAHWKQNHFVVVVSINKKYVTVADPAIGIVKYSKADFLSAWVSTGENEGILLLLEPTPFMGDLEQDETEPKNGFLFILSYVKSYKKYFIQLLFGLIFGSLLTLTFPFLMQALVDVGVANQDLNFIYTILLAQMMLFLSQMSVDFIRSWILLHVGTRVNISILSDFLAKLMLLPLPFFDTKTVGDLLQRIDDHKKIETFLMASTLNVAFTFVSMIVFGVVLAVYSTTILLLFLGGTAIALIWALLFMRLRRTIENKRFVKLSDSRNKLVQIIQGMQELKLNNAETQKRWEWERIQASLFKLNIKSLGLSQRQNAGMIFILKLKDIMISFVAAKSVIEGDMTLGMMLAVQYIIGQMSGPVDLMIDFFTAAQDAKISSERLSEIHNIANEDSHSDQICSNELIDSNLIKINNLSFSYTNEADNLVLKNIDLILPEGKTTAIVGSSGSGKTTLLKLLLKFYPPHTGEIKLGTTCLKHINSSFWRSKCGVVMQDGMVFSDTIIANIAMGDTNIDKKLLLDVIHLTCLDEFIDSLPMSYNTKIGPDGHGLSQGQLQRILIARALYKKPDFLFFDEATSALDAKTERIITQNLEMCFKNKTGVVIAHRLSTVKKADQIIVLENGSIIERGNHYELVERRGAYYHLIKNQLELGA